jgi:hypothetical protein
VPAFRLNITVFLAFVALTILATCPQVWLLRSVPDNSDPYFSMWRLGWVAHTIVHDPRHLFDANIFYPEHDTLGYSDAMLLPGAVLAPLFWMGIAPTVIYNLALLVALALSGFTTFLLARRLTGSIAAGLAAGAIYAFAPYRFTHYVHLELQIVFWLPLALLLLHRIVAEGRVLDGVLLGVVVAAQAFSSVYAAIFFVTYCAVFVPLLFILAPAPRSARLVLPVAIAAIVTLAAVAPYALAYQRAGLSVGTRTLDEVRRYSATWANYLQSPDINRLYGSTAVTDPIRASEMNLFPGVAAIALGLVGVFAARGRTRFAYLAGMAFAFDLSRGINGVWYPLLFQYLPPFRALRSPARIDLLVNLSLAILGAYGVAWWLPKIHRPAWRRAAGVAIVAALTIEYASPPELAPVPGPSQVDSWLARQPPVVIVELPLASPANGWQSRDWLYMYEGLSHFQKMLNGYSGFAPASYYEMINVMASFPDAGSMAYLRSRRVDYVIVRGGMFRPEEWPVMLAQIRARGDLSLVAMFSPMTAAEAVYAVGK